LNKIENKTILVSTSSCGTKIEIEEYIIDSKKKGKTIYIQGGIHGGEITLPIIRRICDFLKVNLKQGKVIFIPFANPISWSQKAYCYTTGKFSFTDGRDFNRCFGRNGDVNCKIASCLMEEASKCDFAIDLHTAMRSVPYTIFSNLNYVEYIKYLGLKFNYYCPPEAEFENTFDIQLEMRKIPNIVIECGSHDEVNEENINNVFSGIINLLKHFNMVEGDAVSFENYYFDKVIQLKNSVAGIINFKKNLGDQIKCGEELYRINPPQLNENEIIEKSKINGVIYRLSKSHVCEENTSVMFVIENSNFRKC